MMMNLKFILNNDLIETEINPAVVLLDLIRGLRLTGTKEGCKEGDCGACTVLAGELSGDEVVYRSVNSCLIPVSNIYGMHIVTIEGLNKSKKAMNPVQQAFADAGASQCGFCTPGFIVSLTGHFLNSGKLTYNEAVDSMDGNICRCTGHSSIIRAAESLSARYDRSATSTGKSNFEFLIEEGIIPDYFSSVKDRLKSIQRKNEHRGNIPEAKYFVSGGTDLFVQKPDEMLSSGIDFLQRNTDLKNIFVKDGSCFLGSTVSVTDILESGIMNNIFPNISGFAELFGSTPIRNSATIGGNINNASPIGDMTAFFMALNSIVILSDSKNKREIPLNKFYKSYKNTERRSSEFMVGLKFKIPEGNYYFNFEKVSKRTYLDIASVNSAILITIKDSIIETVNISAGGVNAVPLYLFNTCGFLTGKELTVNNFRSAVELSEAEISPISDARGSAEYKRLLLKRLIYTHFITLFPETINIGDTI